MIDPFLATDAIIDADHPAIQAKAREIAARAKDPVDLARLSFEFVRDGIQHAGDHRASPTTCRASDVLRERQGWCYAKAHLLVALLRANGQRAALAYQRLSIDGDGAPYSLHGLVAVDLPGVGWYRCDPRGNKPGVQAEFTPPVERLAFTPDRPGEIDISERHARPLPGVVKCLRECPSWDEVLAHLPDIP